MSVDLSPEALLRTMQVAPFEQPVGVWFHAIKTALMEDTVTAGGPIAEIAYLKTALHALRIAARDVIDHCDPDHCRGSFGSAMERLDSLIPEPAVACNHWPGQTRCEVCGMGLKEPPRQHVTAAQQEKKFGDQIRNMGKDE